MNISIESINSTIAIPTGIRAKDFQTTTQDDMHLQDMRMYIIRGGHQRGMVFNMP